MQCYSSEAVVYYIEKSHFIDAVHQYRFSDSLLHEQVSKHLHYLQRVRETKNFQIDIETKNRHETVYKLLENSPTKVDFHPQEAPSKGCTPIQQSIMN